MRMLAEGGIEILATAVSLFGAVVSGAFAFLTLRQTRDSSRAQAHKDISALYDSLVVFRKEHPEVHRLSSRWDASNFARIYTQASDEDRQWVLYYAYVELCLGFCNAVLHAENSGFLDPGAFKNQYKPLVKLLLTEHYPIVEDLLKHRKYISDYIWQFHEDRRKEGWRWHAEHLALRGASDESATAKPAP